MNKILKPLAVLGIFALIVISFVVLLPFTVINFIQQILASLLDEILSETKFLADYVGVNHGAEK